jgi:hypothetical protein
MIAGGAVLAQGSFLSDAARADDNEDSLQTVTARTTAVVRKRDRLEAAPSAEARRETVTERIHRRTQRGDYDNKRLRLVETPDFRDEETVLTQLFSRTEWPVFNEATKAMLLTVDSELPKLPKKPNFTNDNTRRIVSMYSPLALYYGEIGTVTDVMIPLLVFATGVCNCDSELDFLNKYSKLDPRTGKFEEFPKGWGRAIRVALIAAIVASPKHCAEAKAKAVSMLSSEKWKGKGAKHLRAFRKMWCVCHADKPAIVANYPDSADLPLTHPGCWFYLAIQLRCDGKVSLNSMSEYFSCWDYSKHGYDFVTLSELQKEHKTIFVESQECGVEMSDAGEDDGGEEENTAEAGGSYARLAGAITVSGPALANSAGGTANVGLGATAGGEASGGSSGPGHHPERQSSAEERRRSPADGPRQPHARPPEAAGSAGGEASGGSAGPGHPPERQPAAEDRRRSPAGGPRQPPERPAAAGGPRQPPERPAAAGGPRQPPERQVAVARQQVQRLPQLPIARPRIYRSLGIRLIDDGLLYAKAETRELGAALPLLGGTCTFARAPLRKNHRLTVWL